MLYRPPQPERRPAKPDYSTAFLGGILLGIIASAFAWVAVLGLISNWSCLL